MYNNYVRGSSLVINIIEDLGVCDGFKKQNVESVEI